MNNVYAGIEIANGGIKLLVGYYINGRVYILHSLQSTKTNLTNGYIDDPKAVSLAIRELINTAQSQLNLKIEDVLLALPPIELTVKTDTAVTSTVGADSVVTTSDIVNVTNMIKKKVQEDGKKIVAIVPYKYILDSGQSYRELPTRAMSNSLTIEADCELVDENICETYREAVEQAGLKVLATVVSPFATVKLLESYEQIPAQYILLDIGHKLTSFSFVFENRLLGGRTISFGGHDIIQAVSRQFGLDAEKARRYIEIYGLSEDPSFEFQTADGFRLSELAQTIRKALGSLAGQISNIAAELAIDDLQTIILSGGTGSLYGLDEYLSESFGVNVMVFNPKNYGARNKSYANLIGMIKYVSLNPPKNYQHRNADFTLTRVGIPAAHSRSKHGTGDDDSL